MITKRLLTLEVLLLLGLGSVFLLPSHTGLGPAGIAMKLPYYFDGWRGTDAPVSSDELKGLAPDTGFVRQFYSNYKTRSPLDRVFVSIVLSGEDMVNSIHRPERCLSAQGWTVEQSTRVTVPVDDSHPPVEVTRLTDVRELPTREGKTIPLKNLSYYWFIGSKDTTPSHWVRTLIDARDRVLHGENQRWAYVTVSSYVTDNVEPGGRNEADTAKVIEGLIAAIVPRFQKPGAAAGGDATPGARVGATPVPVPAT